MAADLTWRERTRMPLRFVPVLRDMIGPGFGHMPLLRRGWAFALVSITRLHSWTPDMSGPLMFQIGSRGWLFPLVLDELPWRVFASKAAMREHFEALEAAWHDARGVRP